MNVAARYVKLIEWSEEDQCFVAAAQVFFTGVVTAMTSNLSLPNFARLWKKQSSCTKRKTSHCHLSRQGTTGPIRLRMQTLPVESWKPIATHSNMPRKSTQIRSLRCWWSLPTLSLPRYSK